MEDYIKEQILIMRQLGLYKYCTKEDKKKLKSFTSEIDAENFIISLRDRCYDAMDKEDAHQVVDKEKPITEYKLSKRTSNTLMRMHLFTLNDFMNYVKKYGWINIRWFGDKGAKEVFSLMTSGDNVVEIMEKYKNKFCG